MSAYGSANERPVAGEHLEDAGWKVHPTVIAVSLTAVKLVCSAGLTIMELPTVRAGKIFHIAIRRGKFQGTTAATTPSSSRSMVARTSGPAGATSP